MTTSTDLAIADRAAGATVAGPRLLRAQAGPVSPFRPPQATFAWCPMCDGELLPEHAHYRCASCGWRDSCCD